MVLTGNHSEGIKNVINIKYAPDAFLYKPQDIEKIVDVIDDLLEVK